MLIGKTVTELLDAFASPEPTPGGGSAAALAGAVGASLIAMVAGLPKTKNNTPEERTALDAAHVELLKLQRQLTGLIDRDAGAYDLVVGAFRKPKNTPEEKAARTEAIQHAMRVATEVPVETVQACAQALRAARNVADFGNPSAKSDLAVGVQSLMTGFQGALLNVEANIGSVKDQAFVDATTKALRAAAPEVFDAVRHIYAGSGIFEFMKQSSERLGRAPGGH
jgi:formiminotetrahydrofolate cyclodeaminase